MNSEEFKKLLDKHIEGTASSEEEVLLERIYEGLINTPAEWTSKDISYLNNKQSLMLDQIKNGLPQRKSFPWLKVAASIILVCSVCFVFYNTPFETQPVKLISRIVPPGEILKMKLPDSSLVWLNGGSKITYPEEFSDDLREINLEGEGFFDVAHRSDQPFVVRTQNLTTQVLGTRFNVKSYPGDLNVEVSVASGKVGVYSSEHSNKNNNKVYLLAGETVSFNTKTNIFQKGISDVKEIFSWTAGKFIYKNTPLWKVADDLENKYGVKISLGDNIKECPVYGTFINKSAEQIINLIVVSINGKINKSGEVYHLEGKACL